MRTTVLYIFLFSFFMGCGNVDTPLKSTMTPHFMEASNIDEATKEKYLNALNQVRSKAQSCGDKHMKAASGLKWSDALYRAAYEHSVDMAQSNTFSHYGSNTQSDWTAQVQNLDKGSTLQERIENNGYTQWQSIAENIAKNQNSIDSVIKSWMESPGHCKNIMNPKFTEVGMAKVEKEGIFYWTQNFGTRN